VLNHSTNVTLREVRLHSSSCAFVEAWITMNLPASSMQAETVFDLIRVTKSETASYIRHPLFHLFLSTLYILRSEIEKRHVFCVHDGRYKI
jgi:hypothetical protein